MGANPFTPIVPEITTANDKFPPSTGGKGQMYQMAQQIIEMPQPANGAAANESRSTRARGVFVPLALIDINDGNLHDATLFAQIMYWHESTAQGDSRLRVEHDGQRWIAKNHGDWWDECRINKATVRKCLERLKSRGLIVYKLHGFNGTKTPLIRVNWSVYHALIGQWQTDNEATTPCPAVTRPLSWQDIPPVLAGHTPLSQQDIPLSCEVKSNTETTTESESETTTQTTAESSSRARAHEGAPDAPADTTTTDAPMNMQEMLHKNGKAPELESSAAPSGNTPAAPRTPPPSSAPPPSPGALAGDALWRAYVAGGGIDAVPTKAFSLYAGAWQRLIDAGASAEEVERLTRDKLRDRAPDKPYRFTFLADDLAEWRRGKRRPLDVMREDGGRYMTGEFAAYFANNRSQTAQANLGG